MSVVPKKRKACDAVVPFASDDELKESAYKLFETKKQILVCAEQLSKLRKIAEVESKRIQLYMQNAAEPALAVDKDKLIYHKTAVKKPQPTYDDACTVIKEIMPQIDLKIIDQRVDAICEGKKEVVHSIETQVLMFKKI
jgi:hypothetical protein